MNIEQDIFKKSDILFEQLETYGFKHTGGCYIIEKIFMDGEFKAVIEVSKSGRVSGKVIDITNDEEYIPLRFEYAKSAYAGLVKAAYIDILNDIKEKCTIPRYFIFPQTNRITNLINKEWNVAPDFPWAGDKTYGEAGVFRNIKTKKWFALIMNIDKSKIDKSQNGTVEVMNIKLDKELISELIKNNGFYPAYHMNKKYWITITLNETLPDETIMKYIKESYAYVK